jgi:hydrogenase/urease accessory protein HupE
MRRLALAGACTALALLSAPAGEAHELRPGYLELREREPELFDVLWKVPARGELRLALAATLPERCEERTARSATRVDAAVAERWSVRCEGGLSGGTIAIAGLAETLTDVLVRIEGFDGSARIARLTAKEPAFVVPAEPGGAEVAATYLRLGVEHILGGVDHLLFVLALVLLVRGTRRLVWTVTSFTVAHSLTLAAATLGFVHVRQGPVEAVIALSIVFVAGEIVHGARGRPGLTARSPWIVAFVFGLLHGLGFAGALREVGLPQQSIPLALLFFNVGVELGQLLFIACVLPLAALGRRAAERWPLASAQLPAYAIGSVAAWWTLERIALWL